MGPLRLVVALGRLRRLVPKKLLEKLLPHALVCEALRDGVPEEVWVDALLNPRVGATSLTICWMRRFE